MADSGRRCIRNRAFFSDSIAAFDHRDVVAVSVVENLGGDQSFGFFGGRNNGNYRHFDGAWISRC